MKKTDNKTLSLIEEVQKRKKDLQKLEKHTWQTNCFCSYEGTKANINIRVIDDISLLIKIYGYILAKQTEYQQSVTALGISQVEFPFLFSGYTVESWKKDIQAVISAIVKNKKEKELSELEKRLEGLISTDLKTQIELEEIEKTLKG